MTTPFTEVPLLGGRSTLAVFRVGETVRRVNPYPNPLAAPLLLFLERAGFDGTPHFLGTDEQGRETLAYIPGTVPTELLHHSDDHLCAAARLLRCFHDATANFPELNGAEVICHNDFSPGNCVYVDGYPVAMIDFDTLAPGTRLWDLGYSVPTFLNLGHADYSVDAQLRRMRLFANAYGLPPDQLGDLAVNIAAHLSSCARWAQDIGSKDISEWASCGRDWFVTHILGLLLPSGRARITKLCEIRHEIESPSSWQEWERLVRA
jgi:Ser/Thr protein kinase RdoA (MazF antagonist)